MNTAFACVLAFGVLAAPPAATNQDALKTIERTRGGRHWVDAKTAPPRSPAESLKAFQVEPGLAIQLAAAEPIVMDPVAIAFDERGRMFVVEYGDYPTGPEQKGAPPLSRVVMLEDADGDGVMDRRHLFADRLTFAHSLMPYRGGLLVGAQSEILFLKDTDGDFQADVREVLFRGFQAAHPQMQIGNPRWGLDNWIYFNYGPGKITAPGHPDRPPLTMPRNEFRYDPVRGGFGPATGLGQFGNTIDNWGRRFFCTNRNPIMTPLLNWHQWRRNPQVVISRAHYDVGAAGGATRVYPLVAMKSNYLSHAGTHTSACGTTAYHGDLLGGTFSDSVFVCEPIGHLVTRSIVRQDGARLTARRARPKADFLASSDTWFRPASLATGPDGALYLADMYRLWVEHPKFLPQEIAKRLDWRAGDDRGRIWRIVPAKSANSSQPRRFQPASNTADLVRLLESPNGWRRRLGQRLLVERQSKDAAELLARLLRQSSSPPARLHALWTLAGIGQLDTTLVAAGLADDHQQVRRAAVQLAAGLLKDHPDLLDALTPRVNDPSAVVRFELALTLGETAAPAATAALVKLAILDANDSACVTAILTSAKDRAGAILKGVTSNSRFTATGTSGRATLVKELATAVGSRGDLEELKATLGQLATTTQASWWQTALVNGLAAGLPRHRGPLGRTSLAQLISKPPASLAPHIKVVGRLLDQAQTVALDTSRNQQDRVAAIELLAHQPFDRARETLDQLLSPQQPAAVQTAAVATMRRRGGAAAAEIVLRRWSSLLPDVRGPALGLLLARTDSTRLALQAMADGKVNPAVIGIDQRVRLLRHGDVSVRSLAEKLLGGAVSANRRAVAEQYRPALTLKATATAGAKVFQRNCAKCHKLDGQGHEVGPDISDVRNRSREALLYDILDPNRKLEPRFTDYTVITDDGRVLNGLLVSENATAIVLRQAEGKQQVVPRNQIDTLKAGGKSLMPEGVEKDITVQQMADLLEFLKSRKT